MNKAGRISLAGCCCRALGQLGLPCVNPGVGARLPSKAAKLCFEQSARPLLGIPWGDVLLYAGFTSFAGSQVGHPARLTGHAGLAGWGMDGPHCATMLWAVPHSSGGLNEPLLDQPRQNV